LSLAEPRLEQFGDSALLVTLADAISLDISARVRRLAGALVADPPPGLVSLVPGFATLLIELDPAQAYSEAVEAAVDRALGASDRDVVPHDAPRTRTIPVAYGGDAGPDLDRVAQLAGRTPAEIVAAHTGTELTCHLIGFAPGFPYLGDLPEELAVPRLATPRTSTSPGSVGVAGRLVGIYPRDAPGGWRVIGRTPVRLFDPLREPPTYLAPGDRVRFVEVSHADAGWLPPEPADW
jgi:KipI family sensor histidine kinase inhibitor